MLLYLERLSTTFQLTVGQNWVDLNTGRLTRGHLDLCGSVL